MGIKAALPHAPHLLEFGPRDLIVFPSEAGVQKGGTSYHKTHLFYRTHSFTEG